MTTQTTHQTEEEVSSNLLGHDADGGVVIPGDVFEILDGHEAEGRWLVSCRQPFRDEGAVLLLEVDGFGNWLGSTRIVPLGQLRYWKPKRRRR